MKNATVSPTPRPPVKPEDLLTDAEILQLMQVFTRGKVEVFEDDCVVVLQWAQEQRFRSLLLGWILDGSLQPHVVNGEVRVSLPAGTHTGGERIYGN